MDECYSWLKRVYIVSKYKIKPVFHGQASKII